MLYQGEWLSLAHFHGMYIVFGDKMYFNQICDFERFFAKIMKMKKQRAKSNAYIHRVVLFLILTNQADCF